VGVAANMRNYPASQLLRLDAKFKINGPILQNRRPANLNICFGTHDAKVFLSNLQPHVAASQGSACSSGFEEPFHVLRKIGSSHSVLVF
jgi:cysteine desulfurase